MDEATGVRTGVNFILEKHGMIMTLHRKRSKDSLQLGTKQKRSWEVQEIVRNTDTWFYFFPSTLCSGPTINHEAFAAAVLFCRSTPGEEHCCNFYLDDKTLHSATPCKSRKSHSLPWSCHTRSLVTEGEQIWETSFSNECCGWGPDYFETFLVWPGCQRSLKVSLVHAFLFSCFWKQRCEELVLICKVKYHVLSFFHVLLFCYRYCVVWSFKLDRFLYCFNGSRHWCRI